MTSPEEYQEYAHQLRQRLGQFVSLSGEEVTRPELGELSFVAAEATLRRVQMVAVALNAAPIEDMTDRAISDAIHGFDRVISQIKRMQEFSLTQNFSGSPLNAVQDLVNQFEQEVRQTFSERVALALAFAGAHRSSENAIAAAGEIRSIVAEATGLRDELRTIKGDVDTLAKLTREGAQGVGTAQHAVHFAAVADEHKKTSARWLIATALAAGVTGWFAWVNYSHTTDLTATLPSSIAIQMVVAKLIVFSVFVTGTVWCGQIYRSHRHNYVVNRHRQNALSSFETFAKATNDESTRNAVLIQATQSIFAPQATGYLGGDKDVQASPQMLEVIRTIGAASK